MGVSGVKKLIIICIFSICLCLGALEIRSRIVDLSGRGIAYATIQAGNSFVFSDAEGLFHLQTRADTLIVSRIGYQTRTVATATIGATIMLEADPVNMPIIRVYDRYDRGSSAALDARSIHPDTNSGLRTVGDILLDQYIMDSPNTALSGEAQNISILGNLSRHTLVLLDGNPVSNSGEAFDFSRIPASEISHVEIIKGASSVYGGSSAIGGIINIVSLKPQTERKMELEGGLGSYGMYQCRALGSLSGAGYNLSLQYSRNFAENDFRYSSTQGSGKRENNSTKQDHIFIKAALASGKSQFETLINYHKFHRELPGTVNNLPLFDHAAMKGEDAIYRQAFITSAKHWNNEVSLQADHSFSEYENLASSIPVYRSHTKTRSANILLKDAFSLNHDPFSLDFGIEQRLMMYGEKSLFPESQEWQRPTPKWLTALWAFARHQKDWDLFTWEQGFGIRQDWVYPDKYSEVFTPLRLEQSLTLHLPLELKAYGNIGTAYSLPAFRDMYWMGDSQAQGNPDLKSESSRGGMIGFSAANRFTRASAEYSISNIHDLIRWHQHDGYTWKPYNVGKAELRNLELGLSLYPLSFVCLEGGIVFSKAKDRSGSANNPANPTYGKNLLYTPDIKAGATLKLQSPHAGAQLSYRYTGEQYTTPDNLIGPIPDFATWHLGLWLKSPLKILPLSLDLKLENLSDERYEIYAHTPQPGFNWSLGLSLSLRK